MPTALKLESLSKSYGELVVLKDLSLALDPGQLLALLGPSGCGKTTTLNLIAGLLKPDAGRVLFGRRDVTGLAPERRKLGLVFQRYALFPHLNVFKNVAFGLSVRGVPQLEQRRRVGEALDLVQLSGLEMRYPKQLSGGQQQRVALARTLVTEPEVLLLDEPLSNLDANLREDLRGFIRDLQRRLGVTTVFVTHDQQEALEVADAVGLMFAGALEQLGSPQDVFERPATLRAARFMGVRNLLAVEASSVGKARTPLGCLRFEGEAAGGDALAIRPERLQLYAERGAAPPENTLEVRLGSSRYLGWGVRYEVTATESSAAEHRLTVDGPDLNLGPGNRAFLHLPPQHLHAVRAKEERDL